jgi:hypothetical protein
MIRTNTEYQQLGTPWMRDKGYDTSQVCSVKCWKKERVGGEANKSATEDGTTWRTIFAVTVRKHPLVYFTPATTRITDYIQKKYRRRIVDD